MVFLILWMGKKIKDYSFLVHTSLKRDEFIHTLLVRGLTGMEFVENQCPPDSPVPGILQARTLEWVAISFSKA